MTSMVTTTTANFITSTTYDVLFGTAIAVAVILLIGLLIQKELFRAFGDPYAKWIKTLDLAIAPMLLTFGLVAIVRVLSLLQ